MKERRRYERRPEILEIIVKPSDGNVKNYTTLDVSKGGMFLLSLISEQVPLGTEVVITPAHPVAGVTPPPIKARVVRSSAQGIGIEFINKDST